MVIGVSDRAACKYLVVALIVMLCGCAVNRVEQRQPINDGPYLLRQSDSVLRAIYVCNDSLLIRQIDSRPDLRFRGLCYDSSTEYEVVAAPFPVEPDAIDSVERVMAVSDIHGDYELLVAFLRNSKVIDSAGYWIWDKGHLVIVGDVFDRGDKVTECLWLLYRLEREAQLVGGGVDVLLGNHEVMVMRGDLRSVNEKYLDGIAKKSDINYQDLFGPDMVLGQWLRSKHAAVKVNDVLFVHGGIAAPVMNRGLTLTEINAAVRRGLDMRSSQVAFDTLARLMLGSSGPLWYRGYHENVEARYVSASSAQIDSILGFYGVKTIVVGHTEVDSVRGLHDNRVMAIDIPADVLGSFQGLLWEQGAFYRVTGSGEGRQKLLAAEAGD
jgi:hypothetical protein